MESRLGNSEASRASYNMAEKGRLTIDLNACADQVDDSDQLGVASAAPENRQLDCSTKGSVESTGQAQLDSYSKGSSESIMQAQLDGCTKVDMERNRQEDIGGEPNTMDVVKTYRLRTNNVGKAAEFLGEAGAEKDGQLVNCKCCGKPERMGKTLICDACEQSFHVNCLKLRGNQAAMLDEWVCMACSALRRRQQWALGRVEVRREVEARSGDGDGTFEKEQSSGLSLGGSQDERHKRLKRDRETEDDVGPVKKSLGTALSGSDETRARISSRLKSLSHLKEDDRLKETATSISDKVHAVDYGPASVQRDSPQTSLSSSSKEQDDEAEASSKDMYLERLGRQHMQKLKEFISQHNGVLEDGWRVGVKKRPRSERVVDVTFYSPDGQKFRSRLEVARYLGLLEQKRGDADSREWVTPLARVRKRKDRVRGQKHGYPSEEEDQSDEESQDMTKRRKSDVQFSPGFADAFSELELQLPLQCMDLRVESLGVVELRPGYYDENHIWPVGYRCSWHDTVTGSVCISEVLDGGSSCPIFRIIRLPCSNLSDSCNGHDVQRPDLTEMPDETDQDHPIVDENLTYSDSLAGKVHAGLVTHVGANQICQENGVKSVDMRTSYELESAHSVKMNEQSKRVYDEEDELRVLLGNLESFTPDCTWDYLCNTHQDASLEQKVNQTSFLDRAPNQVSWATVFDASLIKEKTKAGDTPEGTRDKVKEIEISETGAQPLEVNPRGQEGFSPVKTRVESNSAFLADAIGEIVVEGSSPSEAWGLLAKQLQERYRDSFRRAKFRLGCTHLESSSSSPLGFHLPDLVEGLGKGKIGDGEDGFEKLCFNLQEWMRQDRFGFDIPAVQKYMRAKKAKLQAMRPPPPSGQPIARKVPIELVGDLFQIWEFLCRFSEVLGQKDPPSLEELEDGICDAWQSDTRKDDAGHKKETVSEVEKLANKVRCELRKPLEPGSKGEAAMTGYLEGQELRNGKIGLASKIDPHQLRLKKLSKGGSFTSAGCRSVVLATAHISLLKILLSDLQQKVSVGGPDSTIESKRGKKKDGESGYASKRQTGSLLLLNDFTWPEVARRYIIALSALSASGENIEINVQERRKVLQCIQGDGGVVCGALDGVAGIEADAQFLAEAEKQLSDWLKVVEADSKSTPESLRKDNINDKASDEMNPGKGSKKPAWANALEPVRKLATNVGARIRNCVRDALERDPPEWARDLLEWSISKDVYKGNASGPTKRAVLSVLGRLNDEYEASLVKKERKITYVVPTPALVMRRCRVILRQIITTDDVRVFCNSLGGMVLGYYENEEDNIEAALPMVARPLDFRIIDSRLVAGSYGDSHESFAADMRQLFRNIPVVFNNREDMIKVGESLSQQFEILYESKVINLINGKEEARGKEETREVEETPGRILASESKEDVLNPPAGPDDELLKAPWEEGVCKICGIDKDDDNVLLCDGCDAEYHIYCLDPPLSQIPDGNWYCPSCVAYGKGLPNNAAAAGEHNRTVPKQLHRNKTTEDGNSLPALAASMAGRDYWQLNGSERMLLLKFLCDKVLDSTVIREHLDQSMEASLELHQKLRLLLVERQSRMGRGSYVVNDNVTLESTEVGNKEASMPRKRGRKSTKTSNLSAILEESDRAGSGLEDAKLQAEHLSGAGIESLDLPSSGKQSSGCEEENSTRNRARSTILEGKEWLLPSQSGKWQTGYIPEHGYDGRKIANQVTEETDIPSLAAVNQSECVLEGKSLGMDKTLGPYTGYEAQARIRLLEDSVKVRLNVPQADNAEDSQGVQSVQKNLEQELEVVEDGYEVRNFKQNNISSFSGNGLAAQAVETGEELSQGSSKGTGNMEGTDVECKSSLNHALMRSLADTTDAHKNAGEECIKCSKDIYHESRTEKLQQPPTALSLHPSGEHEAPTVPNAQEAGRDLALPAQTTCEFLEAEIERVEAELMKTVVRRECLGRDALGRVYWALGWEGRVPWLVVEPISSMPGISESKGQCLATDKNTEMVSVCREHERKLSSVGFPAIGESRKSELNSLNANVTWSNEKGHVEMQEWIAYESDAGFEQLVGWLKPTIQIERSLKSALMKWRMSCSCRSHRFRREIDQKQLTRSKAVSGTFLTTKAATILVKKFGPICWPDGPNELHVRKRGRMKKALSEERLFRCDCLELVWSSRCHCQCCHETFNSPTELQNHNNGACNLNVSATGEQPDTMPSPPKVKKRKGEIHTKQASDSVVNSKKKKVKSKRLEFVPPDFSLVVKLFSMPCSTRERVLQIGCIADQGATFVPALSVSPAFDPSLSMDCLPSEMVSDGLLLSDITNLGLPHHPSTTRLYGSSSRDGDNGNNVFKAGFAVRSETGDGIDKDVRYKQNRALPSSLDSSTSSQGTVNLSTFNGLHCQSFYGDGRPGLKATPPPNKLCLPESLMESSGQVAKPAEKVSSLPFAGMGQGSDVRLNESMSAQPLFGRNMWILKRLKSNLLDMESILAVDALEPSRSHPNRRRAWRSFLKAAGSIRGLVQAVIILEQMVKPDYLRDTWCNWTSLSAGAGINTLSSLALRIYSLDAAIKYKKAMITLDNKDTDKASKPGRKKKSG